MMSDGQRGRFAQYQVTDRGVLLPRATILLRRNRHWTGSSDLYADVDEIRAYGQTIVYTVHESVGHLGIFVSGGIAKKEHVEFSSNIDLIDVLPPGLYEKQRSRPGRRYGECRSGCRRMGNAMRGADARRYPQRMGGNSPEDERRFAAAKRVSEINLAAYQKVSPALDQGAW